MKFDISGDLNPGAWFDLVEGKPEEGRICLRLANDSIFNEIRKKTVKNKVEYKQRVRHEFQEHDEDKYDELFWDYCIADWENMEDALGNPIKCTAKNKLALVGGSIEFKRILSRCLDQLKKDLAAKIEEVEKN
ncbi:MAG: hypothetical protein JEY79_13970 [Pseudodesulfovibrio sp.]|nr:hypothetical protein [Pseudodesulfovibrio sp.]